VIKEKILKVDCNISITTNYLHTGISESLNQKIEKQSSTLDRSAVYSEESRLSRVPTYLTVHMVRFYWRQEIRKKAKIMRKVKFPFELDVLDIVTDELKAKLWPLNRKLKEIEKERDERRKVRKKTKAKQEQDAKAKAWAANSGGGAGTSDDAAAGPSSRDTAMTDTVEKVEGGELEEESVYREQELKALEELVNPDLKADTGASLHGLYELCGIVTHKGASADSGHYIGWVKKTALTPAEPGKEETNEKAEWYKFDDDKVSIVDGEKILTLDGGGEDSTAYILLYRSKPLA
jgi:ubiquitin carboxyl-terminal hydrolase 14